MQEAKLKGFVADKLKEAAHREQLLCLLEKAIEAEDFMEAHRLKQEVAQLGGVGVRGSGSQAIASTTKFTALVARPTRSTDERPDYKRFQDVVQQGHFQDSVAMPLPAVGQRLEGATFFIHGTPTTPTATPIDRPPPPPS